MALHQCNRCNRAEEARGGTSTLRTATDLSSVGSMIWDKDDRLIYANRFVKEHNKEVHG